MEDKIILNPGDTLREESHRLKGTMGQTDIWTYSVLDANGDKIGTVLYKDHTAINGFGRSQSLEQRDLSGKVIVEVHW